MPLSPTAELTLISLGHFDRTKASDVAEGHVAVKRFQRHMGLVPDGILGPKTNSKIEWFTKLLYATRSLAPGVRATPVRMTQYHFAEERLYADNTLTVPVFGPDRELLVQVRAGFFSPASLEGSGILTDGRAINVAGRYVEVSPQVAQRYAPVVNSYNRYVAVQIAKGKVPKPTRYFGFDATEDENGYASSVTAVQAFKFRTDITQSTPYGLGKLNKPYTPYKTLATDTGYAGWKNPDPRYKGKGGLIPAGTRVFILERGEWYTANDTGGGIYGAHVDEFVGVASMRSLYPQFPRAHMIVHLPDAAERFPIGYEHGLFDK